MSPCLWTRCSAGVKKTANQAIATTPLAEPKAGTLCRVHRWSEPTCDAASRAGLSPRSSELLKLGGLLGQQSGDQGILPYRMQIARRETTHIDKRDPWQVGSNGMLGDTDPLPV